MDNLLRFINYVKIDTQSDDTTGTTPSTEKQKNLGRLLVKELKELGLKDAHMDKFGNVYGHLLGDERRIGLNAHMDTALEVSDENVNPQIIKNYQGEVIKYLNGLEMNPIDFPILVNHIGNDLVITDGNTLLGADDKAGIAIIMGVLQYYFNHPEENHATICVCFTVDEEIGEGPLHFNYQKMNAEYAYTIDGSYIDMIEAENFNAYGASITFKGVSIHPGEGKDKLVNALNMASDFVALLPKQTPFESEKKEGFYHLNSIEGNNEVCELNMIIRDFDDQGILDRVEIVRNAVEEIKKKYPTGEVTLKIKNQYENMKKYVDKNPTPVNRAVEVFKAHGIELKLGAIRGGTDGATFSKNGLITPNLGTGSYNHHGRFEFLDVSEFNKMIEVVIDLVK